MPLREAFPRHQKYFRRGVWSLVGLGALAYVGLPGATLLSDIVIVLGGMAIAAYLFWCGRRGIKAAQVVAPSAAAFALVALAGAVVALGGWGEGLTGPAVTYRVGSDFTLDDLGEGALSHVASSARGRGWKVSREPHAIAVASGDVEGQLSIDMRYLSVDMEVASGCYSVSRRVADRLTSTDPDEGR